MPAFIVVLFLTAQSAPTHAVQPQRVCGTVAALACDSAQPTLMTLLVQPGVAVKIVAAPGDSAMTLRSQLAVQREQRVCASGSLVQQQNAVTIAVFAIGAVSDIAPEAGEPTGWPTTDVYTECDRGVHPVTVKTGVRPGYTEPALKAKVQGTAWVQAIVGADGQVERVRLLKSLDAEHGLDAEALKAAKQWTFTPATRDGAPVRMLVTLELTFSLRK